MIWDEAHAYAYARAHTYTHAHDIMTRQGRIDTLDIQKTLGMRAPAREHACARDRARESPRPSHRKQFCLFSPLSTC